MAVVSRTPDAEVESTSKGEHHAPCNSFDARSPSLQHGRANRSAAKYLALCTLITAWTRAKFSSPSCLVVAVAVLQRGLAGGPHRFEFGIAALAKRVRPPQLAASFMSANGNSAFIRTINSPEAHSTSHQTPAAQRRLEQRSVPGLLVARNHSPYSLSNVSNCKSSPDEARPKGQASRMRQRPLVIEHRAEIAQRPPEGGRSQHQVSVRREADHIRASRLELIKMVQTFLCIGTEREDSSHEASDGFCFCACRHIGRRDREAAVDRAGRRNRWYAVVAGSPHRGRRK